MAIIKQISLAVALVLSLMLPFLASFSAQAAIDTAQFDSTGSQSEEWREKHKAKIETLLLDQSQNQSQGQLSGNFASRRTFGVQSSSSSDFLQWNDAYISQVESVLQDDDDSDGFYRFLNLAFDADVVSGDAFIYAKVFIRSSQVDEELFFTSEPFLISDRTEDDAYILQTELSGEFPEDFYSIAIELYDAQTNFLFDRVDAESSLLDLSLESREQDLIINRSTIGFSTSNDSSFDAVVDSSGGSFSVFFLLLGCGLLLVRGKKL